MVQGLARSSVLPLGQGATEGRLGWPPAGGPIVY
jgi:hypothetical protein